ncbi:type IV pilus secretin PilQ, partial [bacterium]|nr:type IV pilus secretin PilQ [bacterium]
STEEGPVLEIAPYKVEGENQQARVVIQLKGDSKPDVTQKGNTIKIAIPNPSSAESVAESAPSEPMPVPSVAAPAEKKSVGDQNLDTFMSAIQTKRFSGSPVTIQVRDAELSDVLRLIAEASGFNILVGDGVGGKITLSLIDVPWDQALEVILSSKRLGAERRNNILRIATLANLTAEKEEELRAKQATEKAAPRITRIFPISYADAPALQKLVQNFSSALVGAVAGEAGADAGAGATGATGAAGAGGAVAASSATVQIDQRTNSLIIQDTAAGLDRISKLITLLDVETPQVLIEAKIIEATEQFTKDLSGSLGFSRLNGDSRGIFGSFAGASTTTGLTGAPSTGDTPATQIGYAPSMAFLPNLNRLNALIKINETNNETRVVASPKTVVLNKKSSTILQSTPVGIPVTTVSGGVPVNSIQVLQANLSLNVTPTVTNTGSVLLALDIARDTVETSGTQPLIAPRNLKTEVLVESGSTLVIGGVYTSTKNKTDFGFPFLKDIPFLGILFGGKNSNEKKSELLIFVTPRIVNERSSSVAGGSKGANNRTTPPAG